MLRGIGICLAAAGCAALWMLAGPAGARQAGPSFDCAKATQPDEKAICADPQLAAMDQLIAQAYKDFEPEFDTDKKTIARSLLADRHACGDDPTCIPAVLPNALAPDGTTEQWPQSYAEALIAKRALDTAAAAPKNAEQPIPTRVGTCALTHISALTTRFSDDLANASPDEGSGIELANG